MCYEPLLLLQCHGAFRSLWLTLRRLMSLYHTLDLALCTNARYAGAHTLRSGEHTLEAGGEHVEARRLRISSSMINAVVTQY